MSTDPEWEDAEDRLQIEIDIIEDIQDEAKGITSKELLAKCSIYRVPKLMREGNENAYTPLVVSIGPYHHKPSSLYRLGSMEHYKLEYLHSLLDSFEDNHDEPLKLTMRTIFDNENKIRDSYADSTSHLSTYDFNRMVLIDSIFIIEFFRRCYRGGEELSDERKDGRLFGRVWIHDVERDLLLLENQLPLFILDEIYNIAYKNSSGTLPADFKSIVLKHFDMLGATNWEQCNHLLDLVRRSYVPTSLKTTEDRHFNIARHIVVSPTATSLHEAGVKFQLATDNPGLLLDISFDEEKGILTIPKLRVEDSTLSIFKNMIALEQCMYVFHTTTYLTDYFYFLDCLINTPQDVQLLADAGIVENSLGCEFLCDMFNTISKNTHVAWWKYVYVDLSKQLNNHCHKRWNRHKATLKHKYFRHPWAAISVIYAALLLVLTVAQVTTGILAVPGI